MSKYLCLGAIRLIFVCVFLVTCEESNEIISLNPERSKMCTIKVVSLIFDRNCHKSVCICWIFGIWMEISDIKSRKMSIKVILDQKIDLFLDRKCLVFSAFYISKIKCGITIMVKSVLTVCQKIFLSWNFLYEYFVP